MTVVENNNKYLVALTVVGVVDAISYMLVTPSMIFYVLQNGGNKGQYGLIMSAFSFASFCTKPVIGWWSDNQGFRLPYLVSLFIALIGGIVYVFASALPNGRIAVGAILVARLLGGCGGANSALGYAYVARSVPAGKQTSINSLLALCRILGMAVGPGVNIFLSKVDIPIGNNNWGLDSLNSVGVIIVICNMIAIASILFLLEEPQDDAEDANEDDDDNDDDDATFLEKDNSLSSPSKNDIFLSFLSMDILVPMLSIFSFNAQFQLIETGFAPAAYDALGWGPVQSSVALGSISFIIAFGMIAVMLLSKHGVSDSNMLCGGLILSTGAYASLYLLWIKDTTVLNFYLPIVLGTSSFPFLAATTRSIFTVAVSTKPALRKYHGSMQAVLSMAASVAGFVTPGLVAAYCLRHPEDVVASSDHRELTRFSLFAPMLSLLTLLGMVYLRVSGTISDTKKENDDKTTDGGKGSGPEAHSADDTTLDRESLTESSSLLPGRKRAIRRGSNIEIMLEGHFDGLERSFRQRTIGTMDETIG